jgi:large subunit ribosomal protein L35
VRRLRALSHLLQFIDTRELSSRFRDMPKMKTHSGAKKRFRVTASGKVRARHGFTSHIRGKKSSRRKRRLSRPVDVAPPDRREARTLLAGRGR